jgi:hypothetical protein
VMIEWALLLVVAADRRQVRRLIVLVPGPWRVGENRPGGNVPVV